GGDDRVGDRPGRHVLRGAHRFVRHLQPLRAVQRCRRDRDRRHVGDRRLLVAARASAGAERPVIHLLADTSFGPVWDQRARLLAGIFTMLEVAVISMVLAVIGGLARAALRTSRLHWVRTLGFVLVQVLRGIALYVLVLWL